MWGLNKNQSEEISSEYHQQRRGRNKLHHERVRTNASYGIGRTDETEQSVHTPNIYGHFFGPPKHYNQSQNNPQSYSPYNEGTIPIVSLLIPSNQINQEDISCLFEQMKLLQFMSQRHKDDKQFIVKKKEMIDNLRKEIKWKQNEVERKKLQFQRKAKKLIKKKDQFQKYRKMVKESDVEQDYWWRANLKRLERKIQNNRITSQSSFTSLQRDSRTRRHRSTKNRPYQINIPIFMPQYPSPHQKPRKHSHNHYTQPEFFHNQSFCDKIQQLQAYTISKRSPGSSKRSVTGTRVRTQGLDQQFTARTSKKNINNFQYMEDVEISREFEPKMKKESTLKKQDKQYNKYASTAEVVKSRAYRKQCNQLPLDSYPKKDRINQINLTSQKNSIFSNQATSPVSPIKQIETNSQVNTSQQQMTGRWVKDKDDLQLAQLIQNSVIKKESVGRKRQSVFRSQQDDSFPLQLMQRTRINMNSGVVVDQRRERRPQKLDNSKISINVEVQNSRMKSIQSKSQSQQNGNKRLSVKQSRPMAESTIKIQLGQFEQSRISRRSRSNSGQGQFDNYRRTSIQKKVSLIQEEAEEQIPSLKTTNDRLQINPEYYLEKTLSPDHSQSSSKKISYIKREEVEKEEDDDFLTPLQNPPILDGCGGNKGLISSIQLNPMSKVSRQSPTNKKDNAQSHFRGIRQNTDQFLSGINLVGESKISRQRQASRTSNEESKELQQSVQLNMNSDIKPSKKIQQEECINDFYMDMQLVAESKMVRLSKKNHSPPNNNKRESINRTSFGSELSKDISSLPIEQNEEQSEDSPSNRFKRNRQTYS